MTRYVTSVDGTRIAFDRLGQGPPAVLVGGMFCDRQTTRELAPYGPGDDQSRQSARKLAGNVRATLAEGRRAKAIELFLTTTGMPPEMVEGLSAPADVVSDFLSARSLEAA